MWPASWTYGIEEHEAFMDELEKARPEAMSYLRREHGRLWTRSKFLALCKVDYVNNNLAECFNSWIKKVKHLPLVELWDTLRVMIMEKLASRREIANGLPQVKILPSVIRDLNMKSKGLCYKMTKASPNIGEVSGLDRRGKPWRHTADLDKKECTFRQWQITSKPCTHALVVIFSLRKFNLDEYVHDYYSVEKLKAAYQGILMPIRGQSQWPKLDLGYKVHPPKMTRFARRPKCQRFKNSGAPKARKKHQCKGCKRFGHHEKTCKEEMVDWDNLVDLAPKQAQRKRKKEVGVSIISKKAKPANLSTPTKVQSQQDGVMAATGSPMTRSRTALACSPSRQSIAVVASTSPGSMTRRQKAVLNSP